MSPLPPPTPVRTTAATAGALKIALLYAGVSGLWILLSDRAVEALATDAAWMTRASILKGWFFVTVTALLLFLMVRRLVRGVADREADLNTLIHTIPDLVWLKDPNGVYLACNRSFERLYGVPEDALKGRTDHDFAPQELANFFRQKDLEAIAAGEPRVNEEWVTLADGGVEVLLQTLKTPMYDHAGALVGVLGIGRDITAQDRHTRERSRMQAQLHEAQKLELLGRFAGGVAHDFNNMLGVILANVDLASFHLGEGHPDQKYLREIAKAARHSAELTHQMLGFARRQPLDPRSLDLNQAVGELLGVLGRLAGERIELRWTPGGEVWPARVDPTQLEQVLANLVVNARDAIQGTGRIDLATSNQVVIGGDMGTEAGLEPGDYVCLRISDTGCGMAPELIPQIFEPFFTTKALGRGTGLGLALVHGIVQQHLGSIQVESTPGEGTSFRIFLPRGPAPTS